MKLRTLIGCLSFTVLCLVIMDFTITVETEELSSSKTANLIEGIKADAEEQALARMIEDIKVENPIREDRDEALTPYESYIIEASESVSSEDYDSDERTIEVVLENKDVPNSAEGCKSYNITCMNYTAVTAESSPQYALLNSDKAYTDKETGLRMYDGRYCIALGTGYADEIGTKIDLVMSNGEVVKCILGDVKSDYHTDDTNRYQRWDGSVAETIVDKKYFKGTKHYPDELSGSIEEIRIVEEISFK